MWRVVLRPALLFLAPFLLYVAWLLLEPDDALSPASIGAAASFRTLTLLGLAIAVIGMFAFGIFADRHLRRLCAGAYRERRRSCPDTCNELDRDRGARGGIGPAAKPRTSAASSTCSMATARRRGLSAARCATPCSTSRPRNSTSPRPRRPKSVAARAQAANFAPSRPASRMARSPSSSTAIRSR